MESTRHSVKVRMSEARASQSKVLSNAKPKSCEEKNANENQFAQLLLITIVVCVLAAPFTAGLSLVKGLIFIAFFCVVRLFSKPA